MLDGLPEDRGCCMLEPAIMDTSDIRTAFRGMRSAGVVQAREQHNFSFSLQRTVALDAIAVQWESAALASMKVS